MHIRTVLEVANADRCADPVVGEAFEVVDQILAGIEGLCHRPLYNVLESDVAVQIHERRHDGFAAEVDVGGSGRDLQVASAADLRKCVAGHDEGRVLDGCAAVSSDEPRAFKDRRAWPSGLATEPPEPARAQQQAAQTKTTKPYPPPPHDTSSMH